MPSRPPPPPPPTRSSVTGSHRVYRDAGIYGTGTRTGSTSTTRPSDYEHFVRISAAGEVTAAHGNAERLGALSTYACSLSDAVGQLLGVGSARGIEATFAGGSLLTVREGDGAIIGLKPYTQLSRAARVQGGS